MTVRQGSAADILVDVVDRASDPEGLITKYVQFESFRLLREGHLQEMSGTLQDRLKVLMWYLIDYVAHRSAKYEMPLSAEQIRFLNSPMPIAGGSPAVTVALYNFVARELPSHIHLDRPDILKEALFWWCTQKLLFRSLIDFSSRMSKRQFFISRRSGKDRNIPLITSWHGASKATKTYSDW